jgi:hypothetical protein
MDDLLSRVDTDMVTTASIVPVYLPERAAVLAPEDPKKPGPAEPTKEHVSGGWPAERWEDLLNPLLLKSLRAAVAKYGDRAVDWMLDDAKVSGSVRTVVDSVFCDGVKLVPRITPELDMLGLPVDPDQAALADRSKEIADFCRRSAERCEPTLEEWGSEMLRDAMAYRSMLTEVVYERMTSGDDAGKDHIARLKIKPRECWQLALDDFGNVLYVVANTPDGLRLLPRDRFCYFAWLPRKGDCTGTSALDPAYLAWEFKTRMWPKYFDYVDQFASPSIKATTAPGAQKRPDPENPGRIISAEQDLGRVLKQFRTSRIMVSPAGTEVAPFEVRGEGQAHLSAFDLCDREIVYAILLATRGTLEAKFGSRADSQTSQDVTGLRIRMARLAFAAMMERDLFWPLVARNYSPAAADLHTPVVQLGSVERQDLAALTNAVAGLFASGVLGEEDRPYVLSWLNIPHSPHRTPRQPQLVLPPPPAGPGPGPAPTPKPPPTVKP